MRVKPMPWTWQIKWGNPYTQPPDGMPRVLMSITRIQLGANPVPIEIEQEHERIGFGKGWVMSVGCTPVVRRLSDEARGKIRRGNLKRAAQTKAPLFAEQIITEAQAKNPDYYQGKEYRKL